MNLSELKNIFKRDTKCDTVTNPRFCHACRDTKRDKKTGCN